MRQTVIRLAVIAALATVAFVVALTLGAHGRSLALAAYLVLLCALVLAGSARALSSALPAAGLGGARRRARVEPPTVEQLAWLERQLGGAQSTAAEVHAYFRPLVRQIASASLARRHGIVLERQPERARAIVGEHVWELVRDDRPEPERYARGLELAELRRLIDDLEAI